MTKNIICTTIVIILCLSLGCNGSKKSQISQADMQRTAQAAVEQVDTLACRHEGIIVVSEEKACGVLVKLPNALILQPLDFPEADFTFKDGQPIRLSYDIVEDMTTSCAQAFAAAHITCISNDLLLHGSESIECADVLDVFSVEWMKQAVNDMDARKITKAIFREQIVYFFEAPTANIIYDCYGKEICRMRPGQNDGCRDVRPYLENEHVLLVVNY